MITNDLKLPSNRKFGVVFTTLFIIAFCYFYYEGNLVIANCFGVLALVFVIFTIFWSEALLPLNKIWIRFGILVGTLIGPLVLAVLFFGMFTPIAIFTRLCGRDELCLQSNKKNTFWASRDESQPMSFKQQF